MENGNDEKKVFTRRGRIVEDTACSCGYVFQAQEAEPLKVERSEDK